MSSAFKNFFITFAICLLIFAFVGFSFVYDWLLEVLDFNDIGETSETVSEEVSDDVSFEQSEIVPPDNGIDENGDVFTAFVMCVDSEGKMLNGKEHESLGERFTFGVAGYPEKHEEAMNMESDIAHLKAKIDAGAKYVVTQMFFDNSRYFDFVERCRKADITVPIIPGIKPLTSLTQQSLLPKTFHIDLPEELAKEFRRCRTNDDVKALGVEWGIAQARELKAANVASIHFYSMNAAASIEAIAKAVY